MELAENARGLRDSRFTRLKGQDFIMNHPINLLRSLFIAFALTFVLPTIGSAGIVWGVSAAQAQTVSRISVEGNQRVDDATVVSYLSVRVGGRATSSVISASKSSLLESGLFSSVDVRLSGGVLRIRVSENQIVASVLFEGNQRFTDDQMLSMVDIAARGTYTQARLSNDEQSVRLAYDGAGYTNVTISSRVEQLDTGRVRIVFVVNEGERAGIAAINFTGNSRFDANQLKSVIVTKESHLLSWLFKDDEYNDEKLTVDSAKIRNYYTNRGYPDAQVLSAVAEFDVSQNAYFINFTISEGDFYDFGNIAIETSIAGLNTDELVSAITTYEGGRYSQTALQETAGKIAVRATEQGYAFADVRPRIDRDAASGVFHVTYLVDEGARIYVERINIFGNEKTRDFVIRRELGFAEGDPFNRSIVTRGKNSVEALGFFSTVNISTEPGSSSDKIVVNVAVIEDSTGEYGATLGYASDKGVLGELSLTESNFLGRGQFLKASIGASQSGYTFDFSFTEPRFMGMKVSTGFDIYKSVTNESSASFYGTDTTGGRLRLGIPITREIQSTVYGGVESVAYTDASAPFSAVVANGAVRNKAFIGLNLTYNGLDDLKKPTSGLYATFDTQYVGWSGNYIRTEAKARYFMQLLEDSGIIASVKGQVGVINDLSGAGVHPTDTFQFGPTLVRGFTGRGLGPRLASGEALGSVFYVGASAELEFPIPMLPESYGITGAVWGDVGYIGSASIGGPAATAGITQPVRASIGASLIWESPFGPLRGDVAHVLQKDAADSTQVFQLSLKSLL